MIKKSPESTTVITQEKQTKIAHKQSVRESANGSHDPLTNSLSAVKKETSVSQAVVKLLEDLGVVWAFGVSGGAMATQWDALSNSRQIQVIHCRHESGAAFAALEASLVSNRPVVVFSTAGPGITNTLTGLFAARGEGAKVIHLSACTSTSQRERWAIQETSPRTLPTDGLFSSGALYNYATIIDCPEQLPQIARRLTQGVSQPGGFTAHLSTPTGVQSLPMPKELPTATVTENAIAVTDSVISHCVQLLSEGPFAIWVGYGARLATQEVMQLAEVTGAAVMCSPRAKGLFREDHPQFVGITGLGGHSSVLNYLNTVKPLRTLVLGTRMGEPTSFWSPDLVPSRGFIQVDIDPSVIGVSYPTVPTYPVQADIGTFLRQLLPYLSHYPRSIVNLPNPEREPIAEATSTLVRPEILMETIQKVIVEGSNAVVLAESGNSFTWSTHLLRFSESNRYRVSTGVGSMGHATTGVLGAALGQGHKAVAIVGDGSMLMNSEVSTAVKYQIPAVWIVLNDARYNMCYQGMAMLGLKADALMPQTDFTMIAQGMGAQSIQVLEESQLESALQKAMAANGPIVVDVKIDPSRHAPSKGRTKSLANRSTEKAEPKPEPKGYPLDDYTSNNGSSKEQVSFPMT
ncbi:scytonemin biosynthesis protein ScyA [Lyngbya sp. PCC 8106]|uniref:scytonemin biosynthesis protein ScyA n=1 Tax=Lyngbya sp. (strain PCC 8106) TaxID=313612 RepID=UPI0000EAD1D4|nr:scytonemin biosynthesis protein ScyA [Lyngbya sp. PCC 8106]EAW38198.1 acetolactate synthase large subunit [Lyngbya sp. PCC 8106]